MPVPTSGMGGLPGGGGGGAMPPGYPPGFQGTPGAVPTNTTEAQAAALQRMQQAGAGRGL